MISVLIVGVGGQGVLLASNVLGRLGMILGYDVKMSELHGMAQRGGSVVSHVRIGDAGEKVLSPVIGRGEADILLAMEEMEALRWASYLDPDTGSAYVNLKQMEPLSVLAGLRPYPPDVDSLLGRAFHRGMQVQASRLASRVADDPRAANVALLGAMAADMDLPRQAWLDAIEQSVRPQFCQMNQAAFVMGYCAADEINENTIDSDDLFFQRYGY